MRYRDLRQAHTHAHLAIYGCANPFPFATRFWLLWMDSRLHPYAKSDAQQPRARTAFKAQGCGNPTARTTPLACRWGPEGVPRTSVARAVRRGSASWRTTTPVPGSGGISGGSGLLQSPRTEPDRTVEHKHQVDALGVVGSPRPPTRCGRSLIEPHMSGQRFVLRVKPQDQTHTASQRRSAFRHLAPALSRHAHEEQRPQKRGHGQGDDAPTDDEQGERPKAKPLGRAGRFHVFVFQLLR